MACSAKPQTAFQRTIQSLRSDVIDNTGTNRMPPAWGPNATTPPSSARRAGEQSVWRRCRPDSLARRGVVEHQHVRLSYFDSDVVQTRPIGQGLPWGDLHLQAGGQVTADTKFFAYELDYKFAFLRRPNSDIEALGRRLIRRVARRSRWPRSVFAMVLRAGPARLLEGRDYRTMHRRSYCYLARSALPRHRCSL
jgi:hypothetical protein